MHATGIRPAGPPAEATRPAHEGLPHRQSSRRATGDRHQSVCQLPSSTARPCCLSSRLHGSSGRWKCGEPPRPVPNAASWSPTCPRTVLWHLPDRKGGTHADAVRRAHRWMATANAHGPPPCVGSDPSFRPVPAKRPPLHDAALGPTHSVVRFCPWDDVVHGVTPRTSLVGHLSCECVLRPVDVGPRAALSRVLWVAVTVVSVSRFRMRPAGVQEVLLLGLCGQAWFVWNLALEQRLMWRCWQGLTPGYVEQSRQLMQAWSAEAWLAAGSQTVQQQALRDLDQAWRNFFAGTHNRPRWCRRGRHEGFRIVGGDSSCAWSVYECP